MKLASRLRFLDDTRENMAGIPELPHLAIIETVQHARTRSTPVGRENRLPYREHHHRAFGMISQNLLDCGRPRKQVGQVGESTRITRSLSDVRLNSACSAESVVPFTSINGGCPAGEWPVLVK